MGNRETGKTKQAAAIQNSPFLQSRPSSLSGSWLQHMGVLARRKSPQTAAALSARGIFMVDADAVAVRAKKAVARRWEECIFGFRLTFLC